MVKFNEWIEYRKNKKIAKRELVKIMATTLPTVNSVTDNISDIVKFIVSITNACKEIPKNELVDNIIYALADKLGEDESRVYEIVKYIATLSPDDIRKIIVSATVDTMDKE